MYKCNDIFSLAELVKLSAKLISVDQNTAKQFFDGFLGLVTVPSTIFNAEIYEGNNAITELVRSFRWYYDENNDESVLLARLEKTVCGQYRKSENQMLDIKTINEVMLTIERVFPNFSNVVTNKIKILLIDAEAKGRNAETSFFKTERGTENIIRIYRISDSCTLTPAQVLIHELGHLLHINCTGELKKLPVSFLKYLAAIGANLNGVIEHELLEVFADTFLIAVTYKCQEFGDPFPEIDEHAKQYCLGYIEWFLINNM